MDNYNDFDAFSKLFDNAYSSKDPSINRTYMSLNDLLDYILYGYVPNIQKDKQLDNKKQTYDNKEILNDIYKSYNDWLNAWINKQNSGDSSLGKRENNSNSTQPDTNTTPVMSEEKENLSKKLKNEYEKNYKTTLLNTYVDTVMNALETVNDDTRKEKPYKFLKAGVEIPPAVQVDVCNVEYDFPIVLEACELIKSKGNFDVVTATKSPDNDFISFIMTL